MLFYFQFTASTATASDERSSEAMVVHALIQADSVDVAAEQVTSSMQSVHLRIGNIRRAFVVRAMDELGSDPRLLALAQQASRSRYGFLFEFANGSEALCGPSLSQFIATRLPYTETQAGFSPQPVAARAR